MGLQFFSFSNVIAQNAFAGCVAWMLHSQIDANVKMARKDLIPLHNAREIEAANSSTSDIYVDYINGYYNLLAESGFALNWDINPIFSLNRLQCSLFTMYLFIWCWKLHQGMVHYSTPKHQQRQKHKMQKGTVKLIAITFNLVEAQMHVTFVH